jgi:FMN-dependent oxidoreductase (nitrilotriacetate monooxygenase family)
MTNMFHLAFFQSGSGVHWSWAGGGPTAGRDWNSPQIFIDAAQALERAGFDYILLEDNSYISDRYQDSMDFYLRKGLGSPRQDPIVLATLLSQHTKHIGLVPTIPTFAYHPYSVARLTGTLDQYSGGRAGWNMVTGSSERAMQNYGQPTMPEHDLRYDMADEFVNLVNGLCQSWQPGSVIADREKDTFIDPAKVGHLNFSGTYYASRGPLNIGPLPQGRPVLAQAGSSRRGRQFAAEYADTVVASEATVEKMKAFRHDVRARAAALGRNPDEIKILFVVAPILGRTDDEAQTRYDIAKGEGMANAELALATLSKTTDIDFGAYPLDEQLGERELTTNGTKATLDEFVERNRGKTLREAGAATWTGYVGGHGLVGSGDTVAARMDEIMSEVGGDGFLIASGSLSRLVLMEITELLVPALRTRGVVRTEFSGSTLRDNLTEF